jgi:hypothetical protein
VNRQRQHAGEDPRPAYGRGVTGQRGQAAVEWTGLLVLVVAALAAAAAGARAVGAAGLPDRLACAIVGDACAARPVFALRPGAPMPVMRARLGVREMSGWPSLAASLPAVPAVPILEDAGDFLWRHRHTARKVVVATAIGGGVAATCAAAIVAANAIGAVACGSAVVIGSSAAYDNANR